jgi:hypothetical protein
MLLIVARRFPRLRFRVLADHLYAGNAVIATVRDSVDNISFVMRGRPDAALYELPPPRHRGQKGRPKSMGQRLLSPEKWATKHSDMFQDAKVEMYGQTVTVRVASFLGMAYRTLPGRLVRYVIVQDPRGIYKTDYFFSTDTAMSAADVVAAFARRWPLEQTFRDAKQKLGMEQTQTQLPTAVRRAAPFALILHSLIVLWYLRHGHIEAKHLRSYRDAWYNKEGRPSFSDMLAALRRCGWASAFSDPAKLDASRSKRLAAYLAHVVAAA